MITKPEKETSLNLPTSDALAQALSFLQNANSPEEIKIPDIKKAVECIENGEKEEDNLLPETTSETDSETDTEPDIIVEEFNKTDTEKPDINELLQETVDEDSELENTEITTYKNNLPRDTEYEKEMNDTIKQSLYAYRELFDLGINASSGKGVADIANASNAFLKLAYDARNSKLKHRMDLHKLEIEDRKLRLQELKAFKEGNVVSPSDEGFMETQTEMGIKMTPSLREQLLKENAEKKDDEK